MNKLKHWIINKLGGTVLTTEEVAMLIPGRLKKLQEEELGKQMELHNEALEKGFNSNQL